jgi:uncharacterized protein YcaQ
MESISLETARRLILRKQLLAKPLMNGSSQAIEAVRRLCGVQYDPLPVVEQAHYLTLWNRIKNFRKDSLDKALYEERKLAEFVLMRQTLNIVPVEELPYYYQAVQSVFRKGWVQRAIITLSEQDSREIVERIDNQAMVSLKDFSYPKLRALFYAGRIAIARRNSGIFRMPCYSLFNTVYPRIDLRAVSEEDSRRWLVQKTVSAFGITSASHVSYWTGYTAKEAQSILGQLEREKTLRRVRVGGLKGAHWVTDEGPAQVEGDEAESRVALLSPMDNLTRDRRWLGKMFEYSFSIEYFRKKRMRWQISILHGTGFLGFIDAKMDRPHRTFIIKELHVHRRGQKSQWADAAEGMIDFARFHEATSITLGSQCPKWFRPLFEKLGYECKANTVAIVKAREANLSSNP